METSKKPARKEFQAAKKRRSQVDKVGRRKWIIQLLHRLDRKIDRIDRRTRFLAAGLREWLNLSSDYVTMIACEDELDVKILWALQGVGMSTTELAKELDIDRWTALRRIQRMNKRFQPITPLMFIVLLLLGIVNIVLTIIMLSGGRVAI